MLTERVLRRFVAGKLTKPWLMAVRRGWTHVLSTLTLGSKESNASSFAKLRTFLDNFNEQIRFLHQGVEIEFASQDRGKQYKAAQEKMAAEVTRVDELANKLLRDYEFFLERFLNTKRTIAIERGTPDAKLHRLIPSEEAEQASTQDEEDALLIKHFPKVEESLKQHRNASNIYNDYIEHGFAHDLAKLTRVFDVMMKVLYDDARNLKDLEDNSQQQMGDLDTFTNFDINGVKIIVDDRSTTPIQVRQYIKYIDEAYHALKAKKLDKVWYGTFFIRCDECGGVNYNTGGGVGGNYPIGPDVVNIFSRPSRFIVKLLAHELGHRYWFKFMSQSQRGKFESLVKVHKKPKPNSGAYTGHPIPLEKRDAAIVKVSAAVGAVEAALVKFQSVKRTKGKWWKKVIEENCQPLGTAGHSFFGNMLDAVHSAGADASINPEVKRVFDTALERFSAVQKKLFNLDPDLLNMIHKVPEPAKAPKSFDTYWWGIFGEQRELWIKEVQHELEAAKKAASDYLVAAILAYNKVEDERFDKADREYREEYEQDTRPVTPVSEYGKSNIDEAFAEVFEHYVLEHDMDRDQLESFRSVLTASRTKPDLFQAFLALL